MTIQLTQRDSNVSPAPVHTLRVEVLRGPDAGASFESERDEPIGVGTAEGNALRLGDPKVSRYHLELMRVGDGVEVNDLGSLNGTWAGGVRVHRAVVGAGAELRIGQSVLAVRDGRDAGPEPASEARLPGFVGDSPAAHRLQRDAVRVAASTVSVLLQGETGTGKEVVARGIHEMSPRSDGAFVVVDCGSLPATLIASELFGHERGAFTGADRQRVGAFERADGGTVFLDEIAELPLAVQPALLGVLERRRFRRVGGDAEIDTDVRVISATHRDLRRWVNEGSFRADLYYRLAVARLTLPALRERTEDIEPLVRHFCRELTGAEEAALTSPAALDALRRQSWSGNVRELRNVVESALAMGRLPGEPDSGRHPVPADADEAVDLSVPYREARARVLAGFEERYLGALIEACDGNASEASRRAKMDRNYLVSLLRKHGLR